MFSSLALVRRLLSASCALMLVLTPFAHVFAAANEITDGAIAISSEVITTVATGGNINASATTLNVTDATGFSTNDLIIVDREVMQVTGIAVNALTVTRAFQGAAAAHNAAASVRRLMQNLSLTFSPATHTLGATDKIVVTVPDDFDAAGMTTGSAKRFDSLAAGDVSLAGGTGVFNATETFNTTYNTVTSTLTSGGVAPAATVTVLLSNLSMPYIPGNYSFHITLLDANDNILETGYAILQWSNKVQMNASINEALVFTITAGQTLNFNLDPSVNSGRDQTQYSQFNIKTNAPTYAITAAITNSKLQLDGTGVGVDDSIDTNTRTAATNNDNYVGFTTSAVNSSASAPAHSAVDAGAKFDGAAGNVLTNQTGRTNNQSFTVDYDLDVDYTKQAGSYTGIVTYTATPTF